MLVSRSIVAIVLALALPVAADPATTVERYLSALRSFDPDRMNALLAADAVSESPDGSTAPVDRERMRDMRGFERVLHTKWSWTVADVTGERVTVRLAEENDLYEALGSGVCTQLVVYRAANGRISRMSTRTIAYSGTPFRDTFGALEAWLLTTEAASEKALVRNGHVRFTPESAQALVPWLRKWRATRRPSKRLADGKEWTVENLSVNAEPSYCYDNRTPNCSAYGRLYTWDAANRACMSLGDGWRLPTDDEWRQLALHYGGVSADARDGGRAAYAALVVGGDSGFNAVLGGGRSETGEYARLGAHGLYWSASDRDRATASFYNFGKGGLALHRQEGADKGRAFAVRCVRD